MKQKVRLDDFQPASGNPDFAFKIQIAFAELMGPENTSHSKKALQTLNLKEAPPSVVSKSFFVYSDLAPRFIVWKKNLGFQILRETIHSSKIPLQLTVRANDGPSEQSI